MKICNVFGYCGSNNKHSRTYEIMNHFCDNLSKLYKDDLKLNISIFQSKDVNLKACQGCSQCFSDGVCPQDEVDDMKTMKKLMEEADVIIIGTPVYLKSVSSQTKLFLDRIAYWSHLFKLSNKLGIVLVTSASNGFNETINYLYNILIPFGILVVNTISIDSKSSYLTLNKEIEYAKTIIDQYIFEDKLRSSKDLEKAFLAYKQLYLKKALSPAERKYWEKEGLDRCDKFVDYINIVRKTRL